MSIISFNMELLCTHTENGTVWHGSKEELMHAISEEKRIIIKRPNILERWEGWELPDSDHTKLQRLLLTRARTPQEKTLVRRYIAAGSSANGNILTTPIQSPYRNKQESLT